VRFSTRSGILTVARETDLLWLDLPASTVEPGEAPDALRALRLAAAPVYRGSGANGAIIVTLEDEAAVREVQPDFAALRNIPSLVMVTAPGNRQDVASRVFAAYHGIDEDPVTGSAHCALVPLWAERLGRSQFSAAQVGRRSGLLECQLDGSRVRLGGTCFTTIQGSFQL
jgi:predicted PhzF superfamily epimerase YddE/YHI9